jgi:signal transduction histidine kinase
VNRLTTVLQRIGGSASVTAWAFAISLVDRIIANSIPQIGIITPPLMVRLPFVIGAQLVMWLPLVLLWLLQQRRPKSRPGLTIGAFVFAAILRGWSLDWLLHLFAGTPRVLEQRILGSMYTVVLVLAVCAYVSNTLRQRRDEMERLLDLRAQFEVARVEAETSVQTRNDDLIREVHAVLERELASIDAGHPADAVMALRRTASEIVRPMSHSLARSFAEQDQSVSQAPPARLGWRDVLADTDIDRPFRPFLTAWALSGSLITVAIVVPNVGITFVSSLVIVILALGAGNAVLKRLLPGRGQIIRLSLTLSIAACAGVATAAFVRLTLGDLASTTTLAIAAVCYVTFMAAGLALVNIVLTSRKSLLVQTVSSTEELRRQLVRTRQVSWFHERALARALHGPVQSAVEAAAHRLDDEALEGDMSVNVVNGIRADLLRSLDVLKSPEHGLTSLGTGIARVVGTWEGVCDIDVDVHAEAESILDDDVISRTCAVGIITDAVSNSVRHGKASRVQVRVTCSDDSLVIEVLDDGPGRVNDPVGGQGSAFLDECTLGWSLSDDAPGHRLVATLPIGSPHGSEVRRPTTVLPTMV